jgi:hypothetical protein
MPFSASELLNVGKISLEKQAADAFGSAVEDFTRGLSGSGNATATRSTYQSSGKTWNATSYAAGLAGSDYRPKFKFMFKVNFVFTNEARAIFKSLSSADPNDFTFMVKTVERPKITFEYEDDVNMYNFRTKVLRKIQHQDLSLTFLDDVGNRVFDFVRTLMMIQSPITRRQLARDGTLAAPNIQSIKSGSGMEFDTSISGSSTDTANRAAFNSSITSFGNPIAAIRVQQIFANPSYDLANVAQMVSFDFMNPRIVTFDMGDMSYEDTNPTEVSMTFHYDWLEMVKVGTLGSSTAPYGPDQRYQVKGQGITDAPTDISSNYTSGAPAPSIGGQNLQTWGSEQGAPALVGAAAPTEASKAAALIKAIAARGSQQLVGDAIGKVVAATGGGRFATAIGGAASSAVGGLVSGTIRSLTVNSNASIITANTASVQAVTDSTTPGLTAPSVKVTSGE